MLQNRFFFWCSKLKYKTKTAYLEDTQLEWNRLWSMISELDVQLMEKRQIGKKKTVAWTGKDVLAHLYEWHCMLLRWHKEGKTRRPDMPAKGYNWRMTPELNLAIYEKHREEPLRTIVRKVKLSHSRVMKLVEALSEKELVEPNQFLWTGKLPLCSFVAPNTVSHYRWAQKKIRELSKR